MRFHCLQHVPFETPGILSDLLREKGHSLQYIHLYRGDPLPSINDLDGLVIMGGPMSVHDEEEFPWLSAEKELIAAAIRGDKKVLGICLGAQLIASVSGGRVYPNPHKEIGFWPVQWTATAMQLFPGLRELATRPAAQQIAAPLFHWHGETFDLPPGAILLASTGPCLNQAFRLGPHVLGLQFHPEVTPGIIREMVTHEGHELVPAPYIQQAATILQQLPDPQAAEWPLDARQLLHALLDPFLNS
jgi:GMP synthase-like glutamine amidotransferase